MKNSLYLILFALSITTFAPSFGILKKGPNFLSQEEILTNEKKSPYKRFASWLSFQTKVTPKDIKTLYTYAYNKYIRNQEPSQKEKDKAILAAERTGVKLAGLGVIITIIFGGKYAYQKGLFKSPFGKKPQIPNPKKNDPAKNNPNLIDEEDSKKKGAKADETKPKDDQVGNNGEPELVMPVGTKLANVKKVEKVPTIAEKDLTPEKKNKLDGIKNLINALSSNKSVITVDIEKIIDENKDLIGVISENGESILLRNVIGKSDRLMRFILDRGANPDASMHWFLTNRNEMEILLEYGADPDTQNKSGQTSLHTILEANVHEVLNYMKLLIEDYGAKLDIADNEGKTILNMVDFYRKINQLDPEDLETILRYDIKKIINHRDNEGFTPLYFAVHTGNQKLIDLWLKKGADPRIKNTVDNMSPLDLARERAKTDQNYAPIVQALEEAAKKFE